jgi:large subunit ribosomal protein L30
MAKLKVTLIKSLAKRLPKHKLCVQGLGLRKKLHKSVVVEDTPENRGMINAVNYLLKVETA